MERKKISVKNSWGAASTLASSYGVELKRRLVITNDPSLTAWGWAVIDPLDNTVVECGMIHTEPAGKTLRTRKGDDRVRRIQEINSKLLEVINKYKVSLILSELPHGSQSAVAAIMIGIATGVMQTIGDSLNIPVEWFSESDAKLAVCGKRSIPKDHMVAIMENHYPGTQWKKTKAANQAIADSLAVFYVARKQSTILKMLSNTR